MGSRLQFPQMEQLQYPPSVRLYRKTVLTQVRQVKFLGGLKSAQICDMLMTCVSATERLAQKDRGQEYYAFHIILYVGVEGKFDGVVGSVGSGVVVAKRQSRSERLTEQLVVNLRVNVINQEQNSYHYFYQTQILILKQFSHEQSEQSQNHQMMEQEELPMEQIGAYESNSNDLQNKVQALRERFTMPEVDFEELQLAYQKQIADGGYLMSGHHPNKAVDKYLLNLDANSQIEYDPSLITFSEGEVYNYEGGDEIKNSLPNLYCGCPEDLLSYLRYHLKGITQTETCTYTSTQYKVQFFHTERVHLNMGPGPLLWILSETNPKNWNGDPEYFHQNLIPINVVVQRPRTVVVLPPSYQAMRSIDQTTLISWSILRRNLNTIQLAIKYSDRRCSTDCYLPFPTLILDILNHEVKSLPDDLKQFLKRTLKQYYDEANTKFNERITKHKINGRPPKIFQDYMAGSCETCKKDLFMHYYVSRGLNFCLDCMEVQITSSMYHYPIKYIYPSWQPFVVLTSTYSNRMKHQGCIKLICANTYVGTVDHGTEMIIIQRQPNSNARPKPRSKPKPLDQSVNQTQPSVESEDRKGRLRQKAVIEDTSHQQSFSPLAKKKKSRSKDFSYSINQSINQSNNQSREQVNREVNREITKDNKETPNTPQIKDTHKDKEYLLKKQQINAEIMQLEEDNPDQPVLKKKQKPNDDWPKFDQ